MTTTWGVLVAVLLQLSVYAEQIGGRVITVVDGNTIEVASLDGESYKILLFGIDCPELEQEFGEKAKKTLEKLLLNREVTIAIQGKDRWGNRLGIVSFEGEDDPRLELLKQGLAWTAERNPIPELETVRAQAQENGKGLWKEENPTPPWIFRRQQTLTQMKSS
jgi:micrococcal nuclease